MRMMSQEEDDEVGRTRRSAGIPKRRSPHNAVRKKTRAPTKHSQQEPNTTPKRHRKTPRAEPLLAENKKPLKKRARTHTKRTHTQPLKHHHHDRPPWKPDQKRNSNSTTTTCRKYGKYQTQNKHRATTKTSLAQYHHHPPAKLIRQAMMISEEYQEEQHGITAPKKHTMIWGKRSTTLKTQNYVTELCFHAAVQSCRRRSISSSFSLKACTSNPKLHCFRDQSW